MYIVVQTADQPGGLQTMNDDNNDDNEGNGRHE